MGSLALLLFVVWAIWAVFEKREQNIADRYEEDYNDLLENMMNQKYSPDNFDKIFKEKTPERYGSVLVKWRKEKEEYLKSEQWQKKRQERLRIDNYRCQACLYLKQEEKSPLSIHHISYKNLYKEPMEDLVTLCSLHHLQWHETQVGFYTNDDYYPMDYTKFKKV